MCNGRLQGHAEIYTLLVNTAVREQIAARPSVKRQKRAEHDDYLLQQLRYTPDGTILLDANGEGVMMG